MGIMKGVVGGEMGEKSGKISMFTTSGNDNGDGR